MKRALAYGLVTLLMLAAPGCSSPESLVKQSIADVNALADALEKNESPHKIQAAANKVRASQKRLNTKKMSGQEQKRLEELYKQSEKEAFDRMFLAAAKHPEGLKIVNEMMTSINMGK